MDTVHGFESMPAQRSLRSGSGGSSVPDFPLFTVVLATVVLLSAGCTHIDLTKIFNFGDVIGIQPTDPDEQYYLLKDSSLSSGSPGTTSKGFEHTMNPTIFLYFTPRNEKNHYVAESKWYDPLSVEYRNIRSTHDIQQEGKKDVSPRNPKDGTQRVHSMSTRELYDHKPGEWKVELFLDGELARRFEFSVR